MEAPKIPVSTAYSPTAIPTAACALGYGGGGQGVLAGASGGFSRIDKTCQQLEVARSFAISGARLAYCKVAITTKWAKKAGVKLEDCMLQDAPVKAEVIVPAPLPVQPIVVSVLAPPQSIAPVQIPTPMFMSSIDHMDNISKRKLDEAVMLLKQDNDGHLLLRRGDDVAAAALVNAVHKYLMESGADSSRIEVAIGGSSDVVDLLWARQ